jgi:two-component system, OmpR family, sensor histidine kinase BaeS
MLKTIEEKITIGIILVTTVMLIFVSMFTVARMEKQMERFFESRPLFERMFERRSFQIGSQIEQKFRQTLYSTVLLTTVLGTLLSVVSGYIISNQITRPLAKLKKGIKSIKADQNSKIDLTNSEEINGVIVEFNNLVDELKKIEDMREGMISDIVHELKTPITSLLGQFEGVQDGLIDFDKKRIKVVKSEVERLEVLIEELRKTARIKSKVLNLSIVPVGMRPFLDDILASFEPKLRVAGMDVELSCDESCEVEADRNLLRQVFDNIIENAIRYSKGSLMKITSSRDLITVEDDGVGVDSKDFDLIFERFYRVEKSRNKKTGGLGLGLSIVRDIVKAHKWKIFAFKSELGGLGIKMETA